MTVIIALFNLKTDASPGAYEEWAKRNDIPTVRSLPSNAGFDVYRAVGLRGSDNTPPYQYIEVITLNDLDQFNTDVASEMMRAVASEFQGFADRPIFIMTEKLDV